MKTLLVTGGCGFIGSNFIRFILKKRPQWEIVNLDLLTYAGRRENLLEVETDSRYRFIHGDIADRECVERIFNEYEICMVVNFAAESHVDRSITEPLDFIRTNVMGTGVLLETARRNWKSQGCWKPNTVFCHISTDEVYGDLEDSDGRFTEDTPLAPSSPYSASKAAADMLVKASIRTYGLPALITRCSNNYGPYQFPEKLIPLFATNLIRDRKVPLYGDGLNVRDWIHVLDHCRAILLILEEAAPGSLYNVGASCEVSNIEITRFILDFFGREETWIDRVPDRPGHDRRYAVDSTRLRTELGWEPRISFRQGLRDTVEWYRRNHWWWEPLIEQ